MCATAERPALALRVVLPVVTSRPGSMRTVFGERIHSLQPYSNDSTKASMASFTSLGRSI